MIEPVTLTGRHVTLAPLDRSHLPGLQEAVRDGAVWRLWFNGHVPKPEAMAEDIETRLSIPTMVPFTVLAEGTIVGMTSYMNIDAPNLVLEIGSTWLAQSVQGTKVNPEMKLLLLTHAFDVLGYRRVELRTHSMNHRSRAAIERLGATLEGILRQHRILPNGTVRDSCVYSILSYEWPTVRAGLEFRLGGGLTVAAETGGTVGV